MTPEFIARIHADPSRARTFAFGLVALAVAEGRGWLDAAVPGQGGSVLALALDDLDARNPHLRAGPACAGDGGSEPDARAGAEFLAWARAQRLEREAPLVAYEIAALALGVELPGVILRSLREARPGPDAVVFETPDGGGYATAFLQDYHPGWQGRSILGASTDHGERLAGLVAALRTGSLRADGSVVRLAPDQPDPPLPPIDLVVIYNPPAWLGDPAAIRRRFPAPAAILA